MLVPSPRPGAGGGGGVVQGPERAEVDMHVPYTVHGSSSLLVRNLRDTQRVDVNFTRTRVVSHGLER